MDVIERELLFLINKAIADTIIKRGYWGVGQGFLLQNLQSLEKKSEEKYFVKIASASHEKDATDWILEVEMLGKLKKVFESYGLKPAFEADVESSEESYDSFDDSEKEYVHQVYHPLTRKTPVTKNDLEALGKDIEKLTLLMHIAE